MSACAWAIGLAILAQVGAGGGRYPASESTNPFRQDTPANTGSSASNSSGGLIPIDRPAQGSGTTPGMAAPTTPASSATSPYGSPNVASPESRGTLPPATVGSGTTSATSANPWETSDSSTSNPSQTVVAGGLKPAAIMRAMLLVAPRGSRLPGNSTTLTDAVAMATSRADQSERVEAYWDLCSSVADYYLALREQGELSQARQARAGNTWQQAEVQLASRVATSQVAAVASQYRLASLMGMPGAMPLPADIPHCGDYHTYYERIFAGRSSPEAQQLATLLPKRYAELKVAAQAVTRAEEWLNTTAARDGGDGVETVRAMELLALRRRAFVQIARDYNRRISRYTELSTPGQVTSDRLIGMLIKSSGSTTATRNPAPTSYNRQSQNAPSLPRTFGAAEGEWTSASGEKVGDAILDGAIRPASGEAESVEPPRRERSLLVDPK